MMDKYADMYDQWRYYKRLLLWFIALLASMFFYAEWTADQYLTQAIEETQIHAAAGEYIIDNENEGLYP